MSASSGVVSATQLYGPYGAVRYQSGALPTSYGYTHQRSDAVSGLDYYNARYYDPLAGQFTSADTTLAGGLNRYAYVGGNPETWVDPTGAYAQGCDAGCDGGGDGGAGEGNGLGGGPDPRLGGGGAGMGDGTIPQSQLPSTTTNSPDTSAVGAGSVLEGEIFPIDPEGVGTPQGLETEEQYHLREVQQAETSQHETPTNTGGNDPHAPTPTATTGDGNGRMPPPTQVIQDSNGTTVSSGNRFQGDTPYFESTLSSDGSQYTMKQAWRNGWPYHASEVFTDQFGRAGGSASGLQRIVLNDVQEADTLEQWDTYSTVKGTPLDKMAWRFAAENGLRLGDPSWELDPNGTDWNIVYPVMR